MADPSFVKIRLSISTKLIFMVTLIVVVAIEFVVYVARVNFNEEAVGNANVTNLNVVKSLADQIHAVLKDVTDKASVMAQTVTQFNGQPLSPDAQKLIQNVLRANDDLLSFGVFRPQKDGTYKELYFTATDEVLAEFDLKLDDLKENPQGNVISAVTERPDDISLVNTSPFFHKPVVTVAFLTQKNDKNQERWLVRCDVRQEVILKLFRKYSSGVSYLVNPDGFLIAHSNPALTVKNLSVADYGIVRDFLKTKLPDLNREFKEDHGVAYLGAFTRVGIGGMAVFTQVEKAHALKRLARFEYQSRLLTILVVGLAFILNFIFAKSMTSPLGTLYEATEKIAQGKFDVNLKPKGHDEIGALTAAFSKMAVGLQERDKLKRTFNKFHSKEIAQKILSGEIQLGGERRTATVFFSDIRDFTSMSEKMSPDHVVSMLNEYMTEMVKVINKFHGVVDKYVGDAIMALWGVPNSSPDDATNAVLACLEMRSVLKKLNEARESRGHPVLRIGMGVHTGEVLAGNIGSEEHLEYTVIGDTVNQASRIESANKEIKSDILISEATYALVKDRNFVVGPALPIHVKGKSQALTVYQVVGRKESDGRVLSVLSSEEQERILNQKPGDFHSETSSSEVHPETHTENHEASHGEASHHEPPESSQPSFAAPQGSSLGSAQPMPQKVSPMAPQQVAQVAPQQAAQAFPQQYGQVQSPQFLQPMAQPIGQFAVPVMVNGQIPGSTSVYYLDATRSQLVPLATSAGIPVQFQPQQIYPIQRVGPAFPQAPLPPRAPLTAMKPPAPTPTPMPGAAPAMPPRPVAPPPEEAWYVVRDPQGGQSEGPYALSQLKDLVAQSDFPFEAAYGFREGDAQMTPLTQIPELSRRSSQPLNPIAAPLPSPEHLAQADGGEWFIGGEDNQTFGPYSLEQLREALESGHVSRTTYCWKQGMENWIYIFQIPGFELRDQSSAPKLAPLPVGDTKKPA